MLHNDISLARMSLLVRQFLAKHETIVVRQPPYSPGLAPAAFLFRRLKSTLKGHQCKTIKENEKIRYGTHALSLAFGNWAKTVVVVGL
jgi:transposase